MLQRHGLADPLARRDSPLQSPHGPRQAANRLVESAKIGSEHDEIADGHPAVADPEGRHSDDQRHHDADAGFGGERQLGFQARPLEAGTDTLRGRLAEPLDLALLTPEALNRPDGAKRLRGGRGKGALARPLLADRLAHRALVMAGDESDDGQERKGHQRKLPVNDKHDDQHAE